MNSELIIEDAIKAYYKSKGLEKILEPNIKIPKETRLEISTSLLKDRKINIT